MTDSSPPTAEGYEDLSQSRGSTKKRKRRTSLAGQSTGDEDQGDDAGARAPPKRACNECRQQKLRCDVEPEPFKRCSRCSRLKLECRIDANFKRVGKRSKNAEMEKEIVELRKQLAHKTSHGDLGETGTLQNDRTGGSSTTATLHQELAGSLLELRNSTLGGEKSAKTKTLGGICLPSSKIEELFHDYFQYYHPFLPALDPEKSPDHYYDLSPLLFWTVIAVASRRCEDDPTLLAGLTKALPPLTWETIANVPQNYHVVKALAILCTWPLPAKSTSSDPTFMLCGLMMQISLQTGLHRPSHVQDFSRNRIELREEDVRDRIKTWATCNIVTQSVSTAWGQPPKSLYDWTLTSLSEPDQDNGSLPSELYWRLQVERFVNKVSQKFYNNRSNPIGITGDQERAAWMSLLVEDYRDLERQIARHGSVIDAVYLQAAGLHLRLSAFFDSSTAPNYINDLLELYFTTKTFLESALSLNLSVDPKLFSSSENPAKRVPDPSSNKILLYAPFYFMHTTLAGGFTLMKLLNSSFFARHIDVPEAITLFNSTIRAVRAMSVTNNDLPSRLAEVLAQLWRSFGTVTPSGGNSVSGMDNSLQLKVRCRMSMSLVFDSVWRWREENQFGKTGDGTTSSLDSAVANNPTHLDDVVTLSNNTGHSATDPHLNPSQSQTLFNPSAFSTPGSMIDRTTDSTGLSNLELSSASTAMPFAGGGAGSGGDFPSAVSGAPSGMTAGDYNYEVFDPLTWMLDGSIDFPYMSAADSG